MKKRMIGAVLLAGAMVSVPLIADVVHSKPLAKNAVAAVGDEPVYKAPAPAPASQPAVDPNKVVLTVGNETVTAGDFNALVADLPPQTQAQLLAQPEGKRRLADELVNMKLLSDEAFKRKLDQSPKTRLLYQQVLAQALMQEMSKDSTDDEKFYNDNKGYFDEVKARHILVATGDSVVPTAKKLTDAEARSKAQSIKSRIDKGEDFAAIARAESDDTGSGAEGGDLGVVTRGKMVGPFEQATFALKKGEVSEPVRTQYGYHIIQAIDKTSPTFEQAKRRVSQRRFEMMVDELKKQGNPVYDESFFGKKPEPATQPTTAPAAAATPAAAPAAAPAASGK